MNFFKLSYLFLLWVSVGCTLSLDVTQLNSDSPTGKPTKVDLIVQNFPSSSFSFSQIANSLKVEIRNEDGRLVTQSKTVRAVLHSDTSGSATLLGSCLAFFSSDF